MTPDWVADLQQARIVAVLRSPDLTQGFAMAETAIARGLRWLEVTWTSDRPAELLSQLRDKYPDCCWGAGSLLSLTDLEEAIAAGAQFGVSPILSLPLLERAQARDLPFLPGALTPTEIMTAHAAGAAVVKLFPASSAGGPAYVRSLQQPLNHPKLFACGGIHPDAVQSYLDAGAIAVGLGSQLFAKT
ncbi:bifunctional 4-hydroxy-2-oxoglutarate aldolase/2-dehydro-3-deoxy-phosphogluconate aldolase [Synechococcus elongatus]|uniref:2-keto-3-deoxy-phosphogluconate aldolase n=2 Tax=Synechococcus elongatus TaxID=32046 RepID=Q31SC0_SYNE7|nr:bifunctional 4-hydroxy-2-oxoglutarate aldolase/2-dehydro-3-deoxy-phosphogluconate aldolase [Synechococcus elongatus]ABB56049.1 2-keto-3-deoxy-phosphogluconate aldolase [Synechococcus elongatus PCC 7942 = FACHB-805]AJD56886.1 ketohydroxyglutarate aldolase [Synechococcus elongatus UTEX 2973]MBD2587882.1 bifunctional 4-hydroxy-2-oxoglutarate aldolase/2-dehydro-3-deoxy-phosphogluconate aldolase [Synechococcus elongatus FACHB-242]MBD2688950.1 bifunctional 4-hydroxy-2-oxoglutarate aldolase/2-dehyd